MNKLGQYSSFLKPTFRQFFVDEAIEESTEKNLPSDYFQWKFEIVEKEHKEVCIQASTVEPDGGYLAEMEYTEFLERLIDWDYLQREFEDDKAPQRSFFKESDINYIFNQVFKAIDAVAEHGFDAFDPDNTTQDMIHNPIVGCLRLALYFVEYERDHLSGHDSTIDGFYYLSRVLERLFKLWEINPSQKAGCLITEADKNDTPVPYFQAILPDGFIEKIIGYKPFQPEDKGPLIKFLNLTMMSPAERATGSRILNEDFAFNQETPLAESIVKNASLSKEEFFNIPAELAGDPPLEDLVVSLSYEDQLTLLHELLREWEATVLSIAYEDENTENHLVPGLGYKPRLKEGIKEFYMVPEAHLGKLVPISFNKLVYRRKKLDLQKRTKELEKLMREAQAKTRAFETGTKMVAAVKDLLGKGLDPNNPEDSKLFFSTIREIMGADSQGGEM